MAIGTVLLMAAGILILFGVGQRVLDRLRLTDRQALFFMAATLAGGWLPDLTIGPVQFNLGGAVIPAGLCIMLFVRADTAGERLRAVLASMASAGAVLLLDWYWPAEPEGMLMDIQYTYAIAAGLIAYVLGRSRRAAFIAGVMGVILADLAQGIVGRMQGYDVPIRLGTGGAMDTVVISGLLAVVLAETVGEILERIRGGAHPGSRYEGGEFVPVGPKGDEDDENR